jgi:hypothetical protein
MLSLGMLIEAPAEPGLGVLKEIVFMAHHLGLTVNFTPISAPDYERWVAEQVWVCGCMCVGVCVWVYVCMPLCILYLSLFVCLCLSASLPLCLPLPDFCLLRSLPGPRPRTVWRKATLPAPVVSPAPVCVVCGGIVAACGFPLQISPMLCRPPPGPRGERRINMQQDPRPSSGSVMWYRRPGYDGLERFRPIVHVVCCRERKTGSERDPA